MPRPNKRRAVLAEDNLARRIAAERDARGWTNDGLAKRMTDVGCAMTGSAIFKIEKGEPRRRIVVDELVAFASVFGVPISELLVPPEVVADAEAARRVVDWSLLDDRAHAAIAERDEAWDGLMEYVTAHPESAGGAAEFLEAWAAGHFDVEHREAATAWKMWELTGDEKWDAAVTRALDERRRARASEAGVDRG